MSPRSLTFREQQLIDQYSYCQLGMTPQAFYAKWQVSQEEMGAICNRSVSTVRRWFHKGRSYRRHSPVDLRHLALMDFLLNHLDQIPADLKDVLCPTNQEE